MDSLRLSDIPPYLLAARQASENLSEFRSILAQIPDVELRERIDRALGERLATEFERGFSLGWHFCKQPELLIFRPLA